MTSSEKAALIGRLRAAAPAAAFDLFTLDELCRVVPIIEAVAEREAGPVDNVVAFGAGRRRRARRIASRGQFTGAEE